MSSDYRLISHRNKIRARSSIGYRVGLVQRQPIPNLAHAVDHSTALERLIWTTEARKGSIGCMTFFLGGWPVDSATLDADGTDLAAAVTGRVSLDAFDTERLLREVDTTAGWRELYDGPAPENFATTPGGPRPRVLEFAAPSASASGRGWQNLSFLEQDDGTFTCVWSPGPNQVWEE